MSHPLIRLVAVDVDGTLLDSSHRLRVAVRDALGQLHDSGVKVALATARGPKALRVILSKLDFSPLLICFSGAWIGELDPKSLESTNVLLDKRHTASAARSIVATALAHDFEPNVFTPDVWRVRTLTKEIQAESEIIESPPLVTQDLLGDDEEPNKILLIASEGEPTKLLCALASSLQLSSTATFSKPNYLEIVPIGVNKAKALAKLAITLGVELSQVAALGDGLNDVEMLREAGLGIAMGNAPEAVKSVADWITGTNDEDGVAQAVRRLVTNGLI